MIEVLLCSGCNFQPQQIHGQFQELQRYLTVRTKHTGRAFTPRLSPSFPGSTSEAARIIYPPASRSIMATKGQRLVLECVASGIPTPQVTWAKDGRDLHYLNNTRFLLSNLLIDTVGEDDSGTYACQADNGIISSTSAMVLYNVQVSGE